MPVFRCDGLVVRLAAAVSFAVNGVACGETSTIDPDANVSIVGQVRTSTGASLADRPVRLASQEAGSDVALAVVTLGLACTGGICGDTVRSSRTQSDGTFRFDLEGRDTQTSFGNVRAQVLSASAAPTGLEVSGASVAARFVVQTERLKLPPLQMVDPSLSLIDVPGKAVASWTPSPGAPYTLTFETDSVFPVWQVTTAETEVTIDSRVLEGSSGRLVLSGETADEIEGSDLSLTWRSPGIGYAATGTPVSRGALCRYGTVDSASGTEPEGRVCDITDGELFFASAPVGDCPSRPSRRAAARRCETPTTATIELPSAEPVDLIVVRGCEGNCLVELSSDGQRFRPAGTATTAFAAIRLPVTTVRSVRVGLGTSGLREVSVWGPNDQLEAGLEPVGEAAVDALRRPYELGEAAGASRFIGVVVAVGLAAGAIALAYLAGRRRGSRKQA